MNNTLTLVLSGIAGLLLGAIFFGGLWWTATTLTKSASSKRPALLFLGSMLVRTSVVLSGFYFISGGHAGRLLASLLGFAVASIAAKPLSRSLPVASSGAGPRAHHAP